MASVLYKKLFPDSSGGGAGGGSAPVIATTAQATAGTENTTMMTPLRTTERIHQDLIGDTAPVTGATTGHDRGALWSASCTVSDAYGYAIGGQFNGSALGGGTIGGIINQANQFNSLTIGGFDNQANSSGTVIVGGGSNRANSSDQLILGSQLSVASGASFGVVIAGNECEVAHGQAVVFGRGVKTATNFEICGGDSGGSGTATGNRTWSIDQVTGNLSVAGTVSTGVTFPGFGETFVSEKPIPKGTLVACDDGNVVRVARPGEPFIGVVRGELAVNLGGGDLDNPEVEHDAYGDRLADKNRAIKRRPRGKPTRKLLPVAVELLGRCFVNVSDDVKPGDWLEPGKVGKAQKATGPSCIYVDRVRDGVARVRLRLGDNYGQLLAQLTAEVRNSRRVK